MLQIHSRKIVAALVAMALFAGGPVLGSAVASEGTMAVEAKKEQNVFKGKIQGVSKKAKSIAIEVGKGESAKVMMVRFTDATVGMEFAVDGDAAIIAYEVVGKDKVATVIKPKLAELPEGVTEMHPEELMELVAMGPEKGKYLLVDSRPAPRFADGHIASSVSIPVEKMKKEGAALMPADKDIQLIFYCGGPT
nr:rhodanese-like domain-containing protein [Desulfobulbaceae bacterium]